MISQAKSINQVELIGLVGEDPKWYADRTPQLTTFLVITQDAWKDDEGTWHVFSEWHRIVAWGLLAEESGQYLSKGYLVRIGGHITTRPLYNIRQDAKIYISEVVADNVMILDVDPVHRSTSPESLRIPNNSNRNGEIYDPPLFPDEIAQRSL